MMVLVALRTIMLSQGKNSNAPIVNHWFNWITKLMNRPSSSSQVNESSQLEDPLMDNTNSNWSSLILIHGWFILFSYSQSRKLGSLSNKH